MMKRNLHKFYTRVHESAEFLEDSSKIRGWLIYRLDFDQ